MTRIAKRMLTIIVLSGYFAILGLPISARSPNAWIALWRGGGLADGVQKFFMPHENS